MLIRFRNFFDFLAYPLFIKKGKKPWTLGYQTHKKLKIIKYLNDNNFNIKVKHAGYGIRLDERIIEYPWLFSHLKSDSGNLLDAGSALNFDFLLCREPIKSKKIYILTLAPENKCYWKQNISYIYEDIRCTSFKSLYFDWIVCISTIEHIGLDNTLFYTQDREKKENNPHAYLDAVKELSRILKPGGTLFLTVPFGKYRNHGWFQVFDSEMLDKLISMFSPKKVEEFHYRYLPDGWRLSTRELSKDATCFDIHFQKQYDPDFAAFSRAIACLKLIK